MLHPQPVDLNAVIVDLGLMLRAPDRRSSRASLTELAPDLPPVHADEAQLEQVLMNLILNARDAMPTGGTLTISTSAVSFEADDRRRRTLEVEPGEYAAVSVSDTGVGMAPDAVEHIFEPFYTTKGEYGTGLGLATVYGIVHQSGGAVDVRSHPGVGTTMTVYLPVAPERVRENGAAPAGARVRDRRVVARILLVEDERAVRDLAQAILTRAGHEVAAVDHPDKALKLVGEGLEIDLLVTDIVMPARSGIELAAEITRLAPQVSVIYMSGYSEDTHGEMPGGDAIFMAKPFDATTLLDLVDAVLVRRAYETATV